MNLADLKNYVEANPKLVSIRDNGAGLRVLKYKKSVFFDDLWDRYLEECRGTVVDQNFNLVSYPFTKIYNYRIEKNAPVFADDTVVDAYTKINGFMAAVTWHNNDLLVSTTGTVDSEYVEMAKYQIEPLRNEFVKVCSENPNYTFMFECVHKDDPHIIPEVDGMYYLGHREKKLHSKIIVDLDMIEQLGCYGPQHHRMTIKDLLAMVKTVQHEGFVFYVDDKASKIKSPWYLTSKWVARNPRTDKLINMQNDIKKNLDEEYHGLVDMIRANIEEYTKMNEQERLAWIRKYFT